jgi:hypothetical protein
MDTVCNYSIILFKDGYEIWPLTSALNLNTSLQYKQRQYGHEYGKDGNDLTLCINYNHNICLKILLSKAAHLFVWEYKYVFFQK